MSVTMTKYEDTSICQSYKYCSICRRRGKEGESYRNSMGKLYDISGVNFECPKGLPWLSSDSTMEALSDFSHMVDELLLEPERRKAELAKMAFSGEQVELLVKQHYAVRDILPSNHKLVQALNALIVAEGAGGCAGCKRRRYMREVGRALDSCTYEEKRILHVLVDKQ